MKILCEEFESKYGQIIRNCLEIVRETQSHKPNLREIIGLMQTVDAAIEHAYSFKPLPKTILAHFEKSDEALSETGFCKVFKDYKEWPVVYGKTKD
jgi:hypothetical protein